MGGGKLGGGDIPAPVSNDQMVNASDISRFKMSEPQKPEPPKQQPTTGMLPGLGGAIYQGGMAYDRDREAVKSRAHPAQIDVTPTPQVQMPTPTPQVQMPTYSPAIPNWMMFYGGR